MDRDALREKYILRFLDETTGLLLRAFADAKPQLATSNDDRLGKAFLAQLRSARDLLGRTFDHLNPKPPDALPQPAAKPVQPGAK